MSEEPQLHNFDHDSGSKTMPDGHLEGPQPQHMPRTTSWLSFLFFWHLTPYTSAGARKFAKQLHKFSCFYSAKYSTLPLEFA
jgi:hypothetical protein